jgi:hypothetical protein
MRRATLTFLLFAGLAVLLPATSFAQSAGDEQYVDPFQNEQEGGSGGGGGGGSRGGGSEGSDTGSGTGSTSETQGTTESTPPTSTDEGGSVGGTASGSSATGSDVLPSTGLPVAAAALLGTVFLAAGIALRRRA